MSSMSVVGIQHYPQYFLPALEASFSANPCRYASAKRSECDNECEDGNDDVIDDNKDGLLDEDEMSMEERTSLKERIKAIQLVLTRVSQQMSIT